MYDLTFFFFLLTEEIHQILQRDPEHKGNYNKDHWIPATKTKLPLTRRCPSSPNLGSPEPTTRQTGSLQHRLRRGYCRRRQRRREDLKQPPPEQTHPDPPLPDLAVVTGAEESHRFPDSGKSRARRRSSRERHRQRGSAPTPKSAPAAPPPPKHRWPDTYQTLPYIQAVRRASPTLPLPEQPTEGEEPMPHRRKRWIDGGLSKIASLHCSGERIRRATPYNELI